MRKIILVLIVIVGLTMSGCNNKEDEVAYYSDQKSGIDDYTSFTQFDSNETLEDFLNLMESYQSEIYECNMPDIQMNYIDGVINNDRPDDYDDHYINYLDCLSHSTNLSYNLYTNSAVTREVDLGNTDVIMREPFTIDYFYGETTIYIDCFQDKLYIEEFTRFSDTSFNRHIYMLDKVDGDKVIVTYMETYNENQLTQILMKKTVENKSEESFYGYLQSGFSQFQYEFSSLTDGYEIKYENSSYEESDIIYGSIVYPDFDVKVSINNTNDQVSTEINYLRGLNQFLPILQITKTNTNVNYAVNLYEYEIWDSIIFGDEGIILSNNEAQLDTENASYMEFSYRNYKIPFIVFEGEEGETVISQQILDEINILFNTDYNSDEIDYFESIFLKRLESGFEGLPFNFEETTNKDEFVDYIQNILPEFKINE